jgi:arylsulfotransferase ASST
MSVTRRQLLSTAGGALVGAVVLPRGAGAQAAPSRVAAADPVESFHSRPTLQPPTLAIAKRPEARSSNYLFLAPFTGPGQHGPLIVDDRGEVVWFHPLQNASATTFRAQRYRGKPVLTWWEGQISNTGVGTGIGVIYDSSYRQVAQVRAGNGYSADLHELLLTPQGTALICAYNPVPTDLSSVGGPAAGTALDSIVQEIDVATGKVLFEWHSLEHVPLTESYSPLLDPFDYFHVNSIDVDYDGNLIISAKSTAAVYKLDRKTGAVIWRLGGRKSDFQVAPEAGFFYQHDARVHPDGTLTLFDDGTGDDSHPARGLRLRLDQQAKTCSLVDAYPHPTPLVVKSMGNAQVVPGGGMMVGFGDQPYVTEFGPTGDVRFDAKFDGDAWNYRAFRNVWVGKPTTRPLLAVHRSGRDAVLSVSWNGATEAAYWRVDAGPKASALRHVKTVPRQGFETTMRLDGVPLAVTVTALDRAKRTLGTSKVYRPFV